MEFSTNTMQEDMQELHRQLEKGAIQRAYKGLIAYMMRLRTSFAKKHGEAAVSGLYQGFMDMTYFAVFPPALKRGDLKVAIVFNYEAFRIEAWLAGRNRKVQRQYWEIFKDSHWDSYRVTAPAVGIDAIVECDLAADIDLSDPDTLTARIEKAADVFIGDMEKFLAHRQ